VKTALLPFGQTPTKDHFMPPVRLIREVTHLVVEELWARGLIYWFRLIVAVLLMAAVALFILGMTVLYGYLVVRRYLKG
jgi:hypothetical protein